MERDQMCPDCRKPNKLTKQERYDHKHCDECTKECRKMMETLSAHVLVTVN